MRISFLRKLDGNDSPVLFMSGVPEQQSLASPWFYHNLAAKQFFLQGFSRIANIPLT